MITFETSGWPPYEPPTSDPYAPNGWGEAITTSDSLASPIGYLAVRENLWQGVEDDN